MWQIQDAPALIQPANPGEFVITYRAGCIRLGVENEWGQPYWHVNYNQPNPTHGRIGMQGYGEDDIKVERTADRMNLILRGNQVQPGELTLKLDPKEDESLAELGIKPGASGGVGKCTIFLWRNDELISPTSSLFDGNKTNIWWSSKGAYRLATVT